MSRPDWRNASDYEFGEISDLYWAWEFLRRNSKYQEDWKFEFDCSLQANKDLFQRSSHYYDEIIPGEVSGSKGRTYYFETYGIYTLPNPDISRPQHITIEPAYGQIRVREKDGLGKESMILYKNQAAITFDLSVPIKPQLKKATEKIESMREKYGVDDSEKSIRRQQQNLYSKYLRLLDGKLAGADNKTLAKVVFHWIDNGYPAFKGSNRVRDSLAAANKLVELKYRFLAHGHC